MSENTEQKSPLVGEIPIEKRSYGKIFFWSAIILAVGTLWAVADEVFVRRPWKFYQQAFNDYEYSIVAARRDSLTQAAADADASRDPSQQSDALRAELESARAALTSNPEYQAAQEELATRDFALFEVNREYQFTKSTYDEKFFVFTEAKHHGEDTVSLSQTCWELKHEMDSLLPIIREKVAARDEIQAQIDAFEAPIDSLEGLIKGRTQEIRKLNELLDAIAVRPLEISQTVLPDYEPNEFENPIIRVDRCVTCHQGIDKPDFADAPQPFATHPNRDAYFGDHPPGDFGCTPCHDGQGPALTVEDAHRPGHYWDFPMHDSDMIEAGCQKCHSHRAWLDNAEKLMEAQKKLRRMGCVGCHNIEGYNHLAKVAPPLDRVTSKVSTEWIYDWIMDPRGFRPSTRMPNFHLADSEGVAIVHYLETVSKDKPAESWPAMKSRGNPERGREAVKSLGCLGCHQVGDLAMEAADQERIAAIDHGPDLSRIGNKVDGEWLFGWLKNPKSYNPETRMPSLRLTDREAADITSFLLTLTDDAYTPNQPPMTAHTDDYLYQQGEFWIRTYGCYGCHTIPGMEKEGKVSVELTAFGAKDVTELFFGDAVDIPQTWESWTAHKMKNSRLYQTEQVVQRMPDFAMSDEDAQLFTMLLKSFDGRKVFEDYREPVTDKRERQRDGRLIVEHYNCTGCHIIEGRGGDIRAYITDRGYQPPNLNGEGAKVQSDWLFRFLQGPSPVRPWLNVRMPTFGLTGPEITTINQYFMANSDVDAPFMYIHEEELDPAIVRKGKTHFNELKCLQCHVVTEEALATRGAANLAPNLAMAHERLRPDWIIDWLTDPQKVDPGTNMPSFFYSEGMRMYDDADEQIKAIRDYLLTLRPM